MFHIDLWPWFQHPEHRVNSNYCAPHCIIFSNSQIIFHASSANIIRSTARPWGKLSPLICWSTGPYFWPTARSQHNLFTDCLFHDDFNSSENTFSNDTIIGEEETVNNVERRGRSSTGGRIQEFPAKTKGNNEMSQARQPVSGPRFKPGTSRILCNNATHFTAKFSHSQRNSRVLAAQLASNST